MNQKLDILKMIEAGEISVEKGLELLEAAEQTEQVEAEISSNVIEERYEVPKGDIGLQISLINSRLNVERSNVSEATIELYDNRTRELISQPEWLSIKEENGVIIVKEDKKGSFMNLLDIFKLDKESVGTAFINIKLPKDAIINEAKLASISGNISILGVQGNRINASTVSGKVHAADVKCSQIRMKSTSGSVVGDQVHSVYADLGSTSGSVKLSGSHEDVKCGTVSGSVQYEGDQKLKNINASSVSGSISMKMAEPEKFNLNLSSVSGRIDTSGFGVVSSSPGKKKVLVDNRSADYQIKASTVSGKIVLDKL